MQLVKYGRRAVGFRTASARRETQIATSRDQLRVAASASCAKLSTSSENSGDWPINSPSLMKPLIAPTASICPGEVGRITAQWGKLGLMNSHGTGKMRLVWSKGFFLASKLGKCNPLVGSVNGAIGGCTPLPAKSTHSRK